MTPLTIQSITQPANGTTTINPDGTVTYTPNLNCSGTDTFTYTVSDGNGGTDTATVTITVTPVNDPPNAVYDAESTNEDTAVTVPVLSNDSDPENDPLSVTDVSDPANGTAVKINPDGTVTYSRTSKIPTGPTPSPMTSLTATAEPTPPPSPSPSTPKAQPPNELVDDTATTDEDTPVTVGSAWQRHRPRR